MTTPTLPLPPLEVVAWRLKHPSEPGMIGHYPWTYTERKRAVENTLKADVEPLVRLSDAQASLEAIQAEMGELRKDAERMREIADECHRARRGRDANTPIWNAMCAAWGNDCNGDAMRACIDAAIAEGKGKL